MDRNHLQRRVTDSPNAEELRKKVGQRIRRERKKLDVSQETLAALLGVRVSTVSKWESGKSTPRDHHKIKLARLFKEDVADMFLEP